MFQRVCFVLWAVSNRVDVISGVHRSGARCGKDSFRFIVLAFCGAATLTSVTSISNVAITRFTTITCLCSIVAVDKVVGTFCHLRNTSSISTLFTRLMLNSWFNGHDPQPVPKYVVD